MIQQISYSVSGNLSSAIYTLGEREKLDIFSNGMLVNNRIDGLFPYSYELRGEERILRYTAGRGIKFSVLKKGSLSRNVFLTLFKNMAGIVLRLEEYMLDEGQLLFDDEYIYADPRTLDVFMLFLPTDQKPGTPRFTDFIRQSIFSGIFDTSENTSYLMEISNTINGNPNITPKELKKLFERLLSASPSAAIPAPSPAVSAIPAAPSVVPATPPPSPKKTEQRPAPTVGETAAPERSAEKRDERAGLFGKFFGGKEKDAKKPEKPERTKTTAKVGSFTGMAIPGVAPAPPPMPGNEPKKASMPSVEPKKSPAPPPTKERYEIEEAEPEESENTVMLDPTQSSPDAGYARLEGKRDSILLDKPLFSVGKSKNSNFHIDYIINNEHVGRYHACFERVGAVYYLSDNNSLNGTFVNGERLAPNTRRELKDGDLIRFANEEFTFRY